MDSLPPHLLRVPGSAPGTPARGRLEGGQLSPGPARAGDDASSAPASATAQQQAAGQQGAPPTLLAGAGAPGTYEPAVTPQARPRNVTELAVRVTPATPEPWPAGAYVPVGERGKRAHWTGSSWKGGASPGYGGDVAGVRSAAEQTGDAEQ